MNHAFRIFMAFCFLVSVCNASAGINRSKRERERTDKNRVTTATMAPAKLSPSAAVSELCKTGVFKAEEVAKAKETDRTRDRRIPFTTNSLTGLTGTSGTMETALLAQFIRSYDYGSNNYTISSDVCESYSGGYVICGGTAPNYEGTNPSAFLLWIDNNGTLVRERSYTISGSANCMALGVCRAEGNAYYVTGAYDLTAVPTPKGFLMKVDGNGNVITGPSTFSDGYGLGVVASAMGGCVVSGMRNTTNASEPARVLVKKFNTALNNVWTWNHTRNSSVPDAPFNESWTYVNCLLEVSQGFDGEGNIILGYTHNDGMQSCAFASAWLVCINGNSGRLECDYTWVPPSDPPPYTQQ